MKASIKTTNHLELGLQLNSNHQTIYRNQYTSYPFRLSPIFRFDGLNSSRAYTYLINTSPGLLAGDILNLSLGLQQKSSFYFTDQAATKVHSMPELSAKATINYDITIAEDASLELVPEPIILYKNSVLEQRNIIKMHPTAKLFLTEIVLPGRLARQEYCEFQSYFNSLKVSNLQDELLFADTMHLLGKDNPFRDSQLFLYYPVIGYAIAVIPDTNLDLLTLQLESKAIMSNKSIEISTTILPNVNGILIRALAHKTIELKEYFRYALNCIRLLTDGTSLPHIPK